MRTKNVWNKIASFGTKTFKKKETNLILPFFKEHLDVWNNHLHRQCLLLTFKQLLEFKKRNCFILKILEPGCKNLTFAVPLRMPSLIIWTKLRTLNGVWLFYPLADCPPHGSSSMDGPLFGFSTVQIAHHNDSSPAWKLHPTDSPPVVKPLVHLGHPHWSMLLWHPYWGLG